MKKKKVLRRDNRYQKLHDVNIAKDKIIREELSFVLWIFFFMKNDGEVQTNWTELLF